MTDYETASILLQIAMIAVVAWGIFTLTAGVATWIVAPLEFQADLGNGADLHGSGQHGGRGGAAARAEGPG